MALELSYARPEHQATLLGRAWGLAGRFVAWGGWLLLAMVFIGGVSGLFGALGGNVATGFALVASILLIIVWGRFRSFARGQRVGILLAHLRLAVKLDLPLPAMLSAAEQGEFGRVRQQLAQLRSILSSGSDIGSALRHVAPELPARTIDTIIAAEHNGTLKSALARLLSEQKRRADSDVANRSIQMTYSLLAVVSVICLLAIMGIFVFPRFQQLFRDFKLPVPWEMSLVKSIVESPWLIVAAVVSGLFVIGVVGGAARSVFVRSSDRSIFRTISDRVLWYLPITHAIQRDAGLADVCETLADGIENGRAAGDSLQLAIQPHLNRVLLGKLQRWHLAVENGQTLQEGARSVGLPALMVAFLANTHATNGTAPALRFLSRYYRSRHEQTIELISAAVAPLTSILLGGIVLLIALSIFRSLTALDSILFTGVKP